MHCDRDDWNYPTTSSGQAQCPYKAEIILDDLLETEKLLAWHEKGDGLWERPHMGHTNLNYHAKAFEQADHYLRNVLAVLSNP